MTVKFGVIGDSNSDSYRANEDRAGGTAYEDMTYNWVESLVRIRSWDCGTWSTYSEPRRIDYARNWARGSANSATMLSQGQHTGLAAQLDGSTYAVLFIGSNDIRPDDPGHVRFSYNTIYNDASSAPTVYANPIAADVITAMDELNDASPAGVAVFDYAYTDSDPSMEELWPDAGKRARVHAVWDSINSQIYAAVASRGLALVPYAQHLNGLPLLMEYSSPEAETYEDWQFEVWGQTLTRTFGDEPHNYCLLDTHMGTVLQWALAGLVIDAINAQYGAGIERVKPYEVFPTVGFSGRPKGSIGRRAS